MQALPPISTEEQITGLSCPECFGVLNVRAVGTHRALRFRCRTGHAYSLDEVIVGKEHVIEEHLWAAITALDELATLLRETIASGEGVDAGAFGERLAAAVRQRDELRRAVGGNAPTRLRDGPPHAGTEPAS